MYGSDADDVVADDAVADDVVFAMAKGARAPRIAREAKKANVRLIVRRFAAPVAGPSCFMNDRVPPPSPTLLRRLLARLGPGFITGASDDDPSAIGTYAQAGAQFGLTQLWTAFFTVPFMAAIQEMCGRVGLVTGQGLATVIRHHYARPVLYAIVFLQVVTNTINIGADLSAMANSGQLLWHIPYYAWLVIVTGITVPLIVLLPYRTYAVYLKYLGLTLLAYVVTAFMITINWREVLHATFIPTIRFNRAFLLTLVAVFGTTISPYEFFWQESEEVEELVDEHEIEKEDETPPDATPEEIRFLRWDTVFGMFFSNAISYFIILVAALTLGRHGVNNINTAADAAEALRPLAGPFTFVLFTAGIISAGLLAIPVMAASSAYAIAGTFNWSQSLSKSFRQEPAFYNVIIGSCLIGLLVNALPIPPFKLLFYAAILNGIISPPLLFMVVHISSSRRIMGTNVNPPLLSLLGWTLFAFMSIALIVLVVFPGG
jgi:NRAMP (natural resistance-associated macrophage protein)-like metal ion transporter